MLELTQLCKQILSLNKKTRHFTLSCSNTNHLTELNFIIIPGVIKEPLVLGLNKFQRPFVHASDSIVNGALEVHPNQSSSVPVNSYNEVEHFHGKSGSVSFHGLTYESVEEGKLESAPFKEEESSYLWVLGPAVFISSFILPQFFIGIIAKAFFTDMILKGIYRTLFFLLLFEFQSFHLVLLIELKLCDSCRMCNSGRGGMTIRIYDGCV